MIKNKTTHLKQIYYPDHIPWFSFYTFDYCDRDLYRPLFAKKKFKTLHIDLTQEEETLLMDYDYQHRRNVKLAEERNVKFSTYDDAEKFINLQKSVVNEVEGVNRFPDIFFKGAEYRLFTTAEHEEYGVMALHAHLLDREKKIALLNMNISTFREYSDSGDRQFVGKSNVYLFHRDFMFFKSQGFEIYDMGGIGIPGVSKFKKSFGGEEKEYFRYTPIFLNF